MLSSLPPIAPHNPHILYSSLSSHRHHARLSSSDLHNHHLPHNQQPHNNQAHQNHQHTTHCHPPNRTLLTSLRIDENIVTNRKANIRRFGAGWLRPPGVPKTLQGMWDEKCEREEQEMVNMREQAASDALQAAEDAALALPPPERDLDEEVPDAEAEAEAADDWIDDEASSNPADPYEGEGDYADTNVLNDEGEGDGGDIGEEGRDLDDDVPEAGSYQHTDTDVEDSSFEDEGGVFGEDRGMGRGRMSLD